MHSMTGFGAGSAPWGQGRITVDVRTVNHRFLEVRVNAPSELHRVEHAIERMARDRLSRGFCTVSVSFESCGVRSVAINKEALKAHLASLEKIGKEIGIGLADLIPLAEFAPDLYSTTNEQCGESLDKSVMEALKEAVKNLISMRASEGDSMAAEISKLLTDVESKTAKLESMRESLGKSAAAKMRKRLEALLQSAEVDFDSGRIEVEIAILADRIDITEELVRLKSHVERARTLLNDTEPVGRRMEFLLQEMVREANTIGSKSQASEVSHAVVEMKADLEKMRELVQNVE